MSSKQILNTLKSRNIRTLGDLDAWRSSRGLSRWAALAHLLGAKAADQIVDTLAARKSGAVNYWQEQYAATDARGGAQL